MASLLLAADRAIRALAAASALLAGAAVIALLALGTADTLGTWLFGLAVPSAIELQEAILAVLIFAALPAVQRHRAHIVVDLLTDRLGGRGRVAAEAFGLLCTLLLFAVLSAQTWALARRSMAVWEDSPGYLGFPLWPFKLAVFLACLIATLETVRQLARLALGTLDHVERRVSPGELAP